MLWTVAGKSDAPSVASAAPRLLPTTFGTATVGGALATTRSIVEPGFTELPPTGLWLITVPGVAVVETCSVVMTLNSPGVPCSCAFAWPTFSVVTSGTFTGGGPVETMIVTGVFTPGVAPAGGLVPITWPSCTVVLAWCTTRPTLRFAIWIADLA